MRRVAALFLFSTLIMAPDHARSETPGDDCPEVGVAIITRARAREAWRQAEASKLVHRTDHKRGSRSVIVIMDEDLWNRTSFDTKLGLLTTVRCALGDGHFALMEVEFRSHRTNKVIGDWGCTGFTGCRDLTVK